MSNKLFIFLFVILINSSFHNYFHACDCKDIDLRKAQEYFYDNSSVIFMGTVISYSDRLAEFKVLEIFKGEITEISKVLIKSCNLIPELGEKWLIYCNYTEEAILEVEECSLSRGFENAMFSNFYDLPPPPNEQNKSNEEVIIKLKMDILQLKATNDLIEEINILRYRKQESFGKHVDKKILKVEKELFYIKVLLGLTIILLIISVVRIQIKFISKRNKQI